MVLSGAHDAVAPAFSRRLSAFTPMFWLGASENAVPVPCTPPGAGGISSTTRAGSANGSVTRSIFTPIW